MDYQFPEKATRLSDEELLRRVEARKKQVPEATEAWVAELQNRGHIFTKEELDAILSDVSAKREKADSYYSELEKNSYKKAIVTDTSAPAFYSRRAIWGFSLFCGCLFGSVLMAINIGQTRNKKGVWWTLAFGVGFTALQVIVTESLNTKNSIAYLWGAAGGLILDLFFWKRFIGDSTLYRARPIWGPLIIAVVFLGLFILALVLSPE